VCAGLSCSLDVSLAAAEWWLASAWWAAPAALCDTSPAVEALPPAAAIDPPWLGHRTSHSDSLMKSVIQSVSAT
jgi:hypothetical protein